ncbi:RDD family protein [Sphaerimonospora cavernae]|uniref:RDD family protein n=1 Tax=Sphaerimonospora cavernae TaxID=1740611 RepID=A0ABV6U544_9ACTN
MTFPLNKGQETGKPYPPPPPPPPPSIYADWVRRFGASIIDLFVVYLLPWFVSSIITGITDAMTQRYEFFDYSVLTAWGIRLPQLILMIGSVGLVALFAAQIILEGRTGQSVGKKLVGIRIVNMHTGQPIGIAMAFARRACRFLNVLPLGAGFLWPLWDKKKQTLADKVVDSIVIVDSRAV